MAQTATYPQSACALAFRSMVLYGIASALSGDIEDWYLTTSRGMEMWLHEISGKWSAPVMSYSSDVGSGDYGRGNTAREAAEDARRRYEAVESPADERQAEAPPPTLVISREGAIPSGEELVLADLDSTEVNEVTEKLVHLAPDFLWITAFVQEPTGEFRALLIDEKTGDVIKTASGDDFHDAVLELFEGTYPPSNELRRE